MTIKFISGKFRIYYQFIFIFYLLFHIFLVKKIKKSHRATLGSGAIEQHFYFIIAHSMLAGCLCIYIQICSTCKTVCETMKTPPPSPPDVSEGMSAAAPSTFSFGESQTNVCKWRNVRDEIASRHLPHEIKSSSAPVHDMFKV